MLYVDDMIGNFSMEDIERYLSVVSSQRAALVKSPMYEGSVMLFKALRKEEIIDCDEVLFTQMIDFSEQQWRRVAPKINVVMLMPPMSVC